MPFIQGPAAVCARTSFSVEGLISKVESSVCHYSPEAWLSLLIVCNGLATSRAETSSTGIVSTMPGQYNVIICNITLYNELVKASI